MDMDGGLMAKIKFDGLVKYEIMLSKLDSGTEKIIGKAIYGGAKIIADEIKKNIKSLPIIKPTQQKNETLLQGVTTDQRKGLEEGFGIAPMEYKNGYRSVKLGFDGYNRTYTKKFPKGQPNVLIARSVEGGTSVRKKIPFVRPAIRATKDKAQKEMSDIFDKEISKIMKG